MKVGLQLWDRVVEQLPSPGISVVPVLLDPRQGAPELGQVPANQDMFQSGGILRKGGGHGACASERAIRLRGHLNHLEVAALRLLGALPERRPGVVLRELLLEDGWNGHEVWVLAQLPCTCKKKGLIDRSFRVSSCGVSAPWGAGMPFHQRAQTKMHIIFQVAENAVGCLGAETFFVFSFPPPLFRGVAVHPAKKSSMSEMYRMIKYDRYGSSELFAKSNLTEIVLTRLPFFPRGNPHAHRPLRSGITLAVVLKSPRGDT